MNENNLLRSVASLNETQRSKLFALLESFLSLNAELSNTSPEVCPKCGSAEGKFIRKGYAGRKQRYLCKDCGKKFTEDSGTLTAWSHQSRENWVVVIEDTLSFSPLTDTEKRIGVSHRTAFSLRHKFLSALKDLFSEEEALDGLIEADETYLLECQKGIKVNHRKPRKHGEGASLRGLSQEQICVCVATDRDGHVAAQSVNCSKASGQNIVKAIGDRIAEESFLLCDGANSYNALAEVRHCKKMELIGHESYDKVHHLNTVNSLHSRLKSVMRKYRGVSTKYLNRYLNLFCLVESRKNLSAEDISTDLRRKLRSSLCFTPIRSLNTLDLLSFS